MKTLLSKLRDPLVPQGDLRPLCLQAADKLEGMQRDHIGAHRIGTAGAKDEVCEAAKNIVALWENPVIAGLPRSDRNAAIEESRAHLIAAGRKLYGAE